MSRALLRVGSMPLLRSPFSGELMSLLAQHVQTSER
jgi:hypothetical protein